MCNCNCKCKRGFRKTNERRLILVEKCYNEFLDILTRLTTQIDEEPIDKYGFIFDSVAYNLMDYLGSDKDNDELFGTIIDNFQSLNSYDEFLDSVICVLGEYYVVH